jgi:heme oxygenase (biliverdin-producing, ferredoxin)
MTTVSTLMRECSMQDHKAAENVHFITHLMKGELSKAHYVEYLVQLAHVYRALERKLPDGTSLPFHAGFKRFELMIQDLENLGVFDLDSKPVLTATVEFVNHLDALGGVEDIRLLAHHYTRYLGDLSGGQAIGVLMCRHYGLEANQLSFYDFSNLGDPVPIKRDYRKALDLLELDQPALEQLLEEVRLAFRFNTRLFEELGSLQLA